MLKTLKTVLNGFRWWTTILLAMLEFFLCTPKRVYVTPRNSSLQNQIEQPGNWVASGIHFISVYPSHPLSIIALCPPHLWVRVKCWNIEHRTPKSALTVLQYKCQYFVYLSPLEDILMMVINPVPCWETPMQCYCPWVCRKSISK